MNITKILLWITLIPCLNFNISCANLYSDPATNIVFSFSIFSDKPVNDDIRSIIHDWDVNHNSFFSTARKQGIQSMHRGFSCIQDLIDFADQFNLKNQLTILGPSAFYDGHKFISTVMFFLVPLDVPTNIWQEITQRTKALTEHLDRKSKSKNHQKPIYAYKEAKKIIKLYFESSLGTEYDLFDINEDE